MHINILLTNGQVLWLFYQSAPLMCENRMYIAENTRPWSCALFSSAQKLTVHRQLQRLCTAVWRRDSALDRELWIWGQKLLTLCFNAKWTFFLDHNNGKPTTGNNKGRLSLTGSWHVLNQSLEDWKEIQVQQKLRKIEIERKIKI